ncbi:MAG: xylulokinase [Chloroflexi bacterium]|nr:xylulokinase [Chloroflexota bacterium]
MKYCIGIDSSTTATKALLMDENGRVISIAATEYGFETPQPLWSEQEPQLWWNGACRSIRQVLADSGVAGTAVKAIGLTGQMHGLVLLDEKGRVLRPCILWNDQRTQNQCDDIRTRLGKNRLIQLTGNDALTGFTAPKILWVREHEPDIYAQIAHILLPKDYLRYKLTGAYASDKAGAAGTLLLDIRRRDWSAAVLEALDIDLDWLPTTFEGTAVTGTITPETAAATGLEAGTPVVGGGGDQAAQAVGVGAIEAGIVALTLGTSGVVFATVDEPFVEADGRLHAFCHAVPGKWHLMGVMLSAAGSLRWFRDTFAPEIDFATLVNQAAVIPPGSEGLIFLPYLTGERTPHPDPLARGAFVGLTARHTLAHMTRAVLEGVAFGLRDSFELMQNAGLTEIKQVRVSGGGAKSPLWRQILADVFNTELVTVNTTEGAAYGAALLASVGAGIQTDLLTIVNEAVNVTGRDVPDTAVDLYNDTYAIYQTLYPALKEQFVALSRV